MAWRELVAREKRAAFRDEAYWGRPIAGFGDPARARAAARPRARPPTAATAPAACFTGDRSGDFLFAALHRTGFANQPISRRSRRRARAARLLGHGGGALRAAGEQAAARGARQLRRLAAAPSCRCSSSARVVVCLGAFAWEAGPAPARARRCARARASATRAEARAGGVTLLGCFHPSQQNTFTGRLTPAMLDAVLERARALATA